MSGWNCTIYGSDTMTTSKTPALTTVQALPDVVSTTFKVIGLEPSISHSDETNTDIAGNKTSRHKIRAKWIAKLYPKNFPSSTSDIQSYFNVSTYKKRYHYIWFNDYPIPDKNTDATKCLAIAITNVDIEHNYETATKNIIIEFEKMEIE